MKTSPVKVVKCPCCVSGLIFPGTKKDKKKFVKKVTKKLKKLLTKGD